jgi:hypothetical protein
LLWFLHSPCSIHWNALITRQYSPVFANARQYTSQAYQILWVTTVKWRHQLCIFAFELKFSLKDSLKFASELQHFITTFHKVSFYLCGFELISQRFLFNYCFTHTFISVCSANTKFYFKISFIITYKIHKISFSVTFCVYLLQHVSASQGHHQATVNWSRLPRCMGSHVNIFTCYYYMSSYLRRYARTFLISCCNGHAVFLHA